MTERPRRRSKAVPVYAASLAAFALAAAGLGWQMHAGRDPAIGATTPALAAATTEAALPGILVRRIVRTRIITRTLPARAEPPAVSSNEKVPVGRAAAPADAAPEAAVPRPVVAAPAPAPALVTRSS